MKRAIIAARAANGVIGGDNKLLWRLPSDLKRFKRLTMGHHLIMGRKTYESIGRPLPGRTIIVVSRRGFSVPDVTTVASLDEAFSVAAADDEVFIGGGADVYRQTLDIADILYLTTIEKEFSGDAYFPEFDSAHWELQASERGSDVGPNSTIDGTIEWRFETFARRR